LFSLIASAKRHELEPFAYLRDVLSRIGESPADLLNKLLPDNWLQQHPAAERRLPR
jgi:transposase